MSPSRSSRLSGMPWQTTSLMEVQTLFGKLPYPSGDGYAPAAIVASCTAWSIASVLTPGRTSWPAKRSTRPASWPAARAAATSRSERWICGRGSQSGWRPDAAYGGRAMCPGTSRMGLTLPASTLGRSPSSDFFAHRRLPWRKRNGDHACKGVSCAGSLFTSMVNWMTMHPFPAATDGTHSSARLRSSFSPFLAHAVVLRRRRESCSFMGTEGSLWGLLQIGHAAKRARVLAMQHCRVLESRRLGVITLL